MDKTIALTVNGRSESVTTDTRRSLLEVLREDLQLTGTKYGCGEGQCRACTVLVDGKATLSCITPAASVDKKSITTIEGLAKGESLHAVQEAFLEEKGMQCGYCTPGMVLSTVALLDDNPHPSDEEIREGMNGQICRCCEYPTIEAAVRRAAGQKTGSTSK